MASVNKVELIGHLGNDPETRFMPNGTPVATVSVATSEAWKDRNTGEKQEKTTWHRVVFYEGLAEVVQKYLKKGAFIRVEGRLRNSTWDDAQGITRYATDVVANEMLMLDKKPAGAPGKPAQAPAASPMPAARPASGFDNMTDDEVPF
jgi:single-strand DNA-binding protein